MTHVLIVEDHEENRNLLKMLLEVNAYRVTVAGDGLEALAAARRDRPDVIVSDVLMPNMDGFALCREWMKDEALKAVPFIFYSATYVRMEDEQFALAQGAVRYLIKPLEANAFLRELRETLHQWAGHAAPAPAAPLDELTSGALHEAALVRKVEDKMAQLEAANRKLRETEAGFRSLFENMLHGFAHCRMQYDDDNCPVDFVYLNVNSAFERLTGLKNVVGRKVSEVIPGIRESSPELFEAYGRVASIGIPEVFEFDFKPSAKWLMISAYSPGRGEFVAVFDDITERKAALDTLAQSESKFRSLIENASDLVAVVGAEGGIRFVSPSVKRMGGYEPDELIGKKYIDFVHPDDLQSATASLAHIIAHPELVRRNQVRFRDRVGAWVNLESIARNAFADPAIRGIVINARDVTENKLLELEREQYMNFFKLSINAMCIADPKGYFTRVNPAFVQLTGFSESELVSRPIMEFVAPEDRNPTAKEIERQLSGCPTIDFENHYICNDGAVKLLSWSAYFDKNTGVIYATAQDITERRHGQEQSQQQLDELRRWQSVMLDRESRVRELKHRINELHRRLGETVPYPSAEAS
jgi:PAS domain S-box-containing protein